MGCVYRARDRRLGRPVAIKVVGGVTPDAIARLRREAEAASSLNHPSIVTIYDIGEAPQSGLFIAMELIDGMNLREWLRSRRLTEQKLDVLLQAARGLAAAHARGIVHRDIKPENIMVARNNFAKLVDFGLAKSVDATDGSTDVMITAHGRVVGTIAYMSPEQLRGEPLDARSDIYSFGCVLRDALGANRMVERCLRKDREERYQSMDALILDLRPAPHGSSLRWIAAIATTAAVAVAIVIGLRPRPIAPLPVKSASIAVLPFRTLGGNAEAYVADGISDALTTDLAKQTSLSVIDRNSSRRYGSEADLRKVRDDLRIRYVLLGSVQRIAQNVRIDASLVDAATAAHVWAEHYQRPISDIFSAEDAIVRAVTGKIAPQSASAVATKQPSDPRVADAYLRARFFAEDPNWSAQDRSIPLLEQVVGLDPQFLPARIALAEQYTRKAFQPDPDRKWEEKAFVELQKILTQEPATAAAYALRGSLRWTLAHHFPYDEAVADYDRALEMDRNLVLARNSRGSLFMHYGLLDEALSDFGKALRLDPFNNFARYRVARIHLFQQKCSEAVAEYSKWFPNDFQVPIALQCAGRPDAALDSLKVLRGNQAGNQADLESAKAVIYALHGKRGEASAAIQAAIAGDNGGSHYHHAMYFIAAAYAQLHDPANALKWLERTSREGMPCYPLFATDHLLDPIRSDPRIREFLDVSHREWEQRRRERHPA